MEHKVKNYNVKNKMSEEMVKNISADKSINIYPKDDHDIVYGIITAKEAVPVTQNGILR